MTKKLNIYLFSFTQTHTIIADIMIPKSIKVIQLLLSKNNINIHLIQTGLI